MESVRVKLNTPEPDLIFLGIRVPKKKGLEIAKNYQEGSRFEKGSDNHVDLFFFLRCPACTKWSFC